MQLTSYESLADAYVAGLAAVLTDGDSIPGVVDDSSVGSSFGRAPRPTRELRPFGFRVLDPRACLLHCSPRQPDLAFALGQWLWVMGGSDELEPIAFYNATGRLFSDDGQRLRGAFGERMRARSGDQLESAVALLRRDPSTRRAIVVFVDPVDSSTATRDRPCAIALQLFIRGAKLEAITTMRSQSALMVLPYDAALFMTIQVWVAGLLGVQAGSHTWLAHSFHIYEDELAVARRVLAQPVTAERLPPVRDPQPALAELLRFEGRLRRATERGDRREVAELAARVTARDELHAATEAVLLTHAARRLEDAALWTEATAKLPSGWLGCLRPPATLLSASERERPEA